MRHKGRLGPVDMVYINGGCRMVRPVLVVDVDVLFLLNFLVDLAWLWATARMAGARAGTGRLVAASALGALLAVLYYFPAGAPLRTLPGAIAGTALLLAAAFLPCRPGQFLRVMTVFFVAGGAQAGLALLLAARRTGFGVAGTNDAMIAVGVLLFGAGVRYLWDALRSRAQLNRQLCRLRVELEGDSVEIDALVDTGNSLRDPLTGTPVAVVEAGALRRLLPPGLERTLATGLSDGWSGSLPSGWLGRCRLLPYRAVGGAGQLLSFRPDRLLVLMNGRCHEYRALVALVSERLDPEGAYRALLPALDPHAEVIGQLALRRLHHA
jgi:stage II sporulation protein GA (sporulation sigma-E factor processing peptidase)